jgi:hypothetical protein
MIRLNKWIDWWNEIKVADQLCLYATLVIMVKQIFASAHKHIASQLVAHINDDAKSLHF